jgi:hypothetical protein
MPIKAKPIGLFCHRNLHHITSYRFPIPIDPSRLELMCALCQRLPEQVGRGIEGGELRLVV